MIGLQEECQTLDAENKRVIKQPHQVTGNFYRTEEVPAMGTFRA